jgi:type IV secretory pathway VirB2 component (pilin)
VLNKKSLRLISLVTLVVFAASLALAGVASAQNQGQSIIEQVRAAQGGQALKQEVDKVGSNIVDFVRGVFGVLAVIFVIWAGFAFWGAGGDAERIAQAKRLAAGFIICLICVFAAEKVVGGILGILGYQIQ